MDAVIAWFRRNAPFFLRPAVEVIIGLVRGGIDTITRPLSRVQGGWRRVTIAVTSARAAVNLFVFHVYATLLWLRDVAIPRALARAVSETRAWAGPLIEAARNHALSLVDALRRAAMDAINTIGRLLDGVERWARGEIGRLWTDLQAVGSRVRSLLTVPGVLAEWLAGAMWGALWRYAHDRREQLLRWVLRSSPAAAMWVARQIESLLVRML